MWLTAQADPINFALTARVRGAFTAEQLRQALDKVRRRYPSSAVRVTQKPTGAAYLSYVDTPYPIHVIERAHAEQWTDEVVKALQRPFDLQNEPPLRFIWLRGETVSEIVFLCHHAFADGLSVTYLLRDLLTCLGDPTADLVPQSPSPTLDELLPDFRGKRRVRWQAWLKATLLRLLMALGGQKETENAERAPEPAYHMLHWTLTAEQTAALVARSRAEGTTVHAALSTAFLRAFGEFHGDTWHRTIQSPINLRNRLTQPVGETYGLYIGLVDFPVDCAPARGFWEVAREIKEGFIRETADKPIFTFLTSTKVLLEQLTPVLTPEMLSDSFMDVTYDLSISNLGRLDLPRRDGAVQLEALYGPAVLGDPEEIVLGVVTVENRMHFTLVFTEARLTVQEAEALRERAMRWLTEAVQDVY